MEPLNLKDTLGPAMISTVERLLLFSEVLYPLWRGYYSSLKFQNAIAFAVGRLSLFLEVSKCHCGEAIALLRGFIQPLHPLYEEAVLFSEVVNWKVSFYERLSLSQMGGSFEAN